MSAARTSTTSHWASVARFGKRYLVDHGIDASRLEVVEYGEERPLCTCRPRPAGLGTAARNSKSQRTSRVRVVGEACETREDGRGPSRLTGDA